MLFTCEKDITGTDGQYRRTTSLLTVASTVGLVRRTQRAMIICRIIVVAPLGSAGNTVI